MVHKESKSFLTCSTTSEPLPEPKSYTRYSLLARNIHKTSRKNIVFEIRTELSGWLWTIWPKFLSSQLRCNQPRDFRSNDPFCRKSSSFGYGWWYIKSRFPLRKVVSSLVIAMKLAILQLGREVFNTEVVIYSFFMKVRLTFLVSFQWRFHSNREEWARTCVWNRKLVDIFPWDFHRSLACNVENENES